MGCGDIVNVVVSHIIYTLLSSTEGGETNTCHMQSIYALVTQSHVYLWMEKPAYALLQGADEVIGQEAKTRYFLTSSLSKHSNFGFLRKLCSAREAGPVRARTQ